jgi:hypothetical protein
MAAFVICWRQKKKLPEFHYDLPQTSYHIKIYLRATIFQNPEGTL